MLDTENLSLLVSRGLSIRRISKEIGRSYSATKYLLNKLGVRTKRRKSPSHCVLCNKYNKRERGRRCATCDTKVRRLRNRLAGIQYLGGACIDCKRPATPSSLGAFQFHHLDPKTKEFNIGLVAHKSWTAIKKELDKCVLLCASCHGIRHSHVNAMMLSEACKYAGPNEEVTDLILALFDRQSNSTPAPQ